MNGMNISSIHSCPLCRCGLPRCPECDHVLPDHAEPMGLPLDQWCPRSSVVRAVKADEKKRGVYKAEDWT